MINRFWSYVAVSMVPGRGLYGALPSQSAGPGVSVVLVSARAEIASRRMLSFLVVIPRSTLIWESSPELCGASLCQVHSHSPAPWADRVARATQ